MSELRFDPEKHLYTVDHERYVSVTEALSLIDDRRKDPFYLKRGSIVHKVTEYYDKNELDEETVDDQIKGYFSGYKLFLLETNFKPRLIEHPMFDRKWKFAGTMDREGEFPGIGPAIVDVKSGSPSRVDPLQGAAYHHLYGHPGHRVFDLYLREEGTYKLVEVPKPRNLFPTFCAVLTTYRFKEGL